MLRIGLGVQIIVYTLALWRDWTYLLAGDDAGLIRGDLTEAFLSLQSPFIPRLGWLVALGAQVGLSEQATLKLALACLLASGWFLVAGLFSRPAAIVAWIVSLAARSSSGFSSYGVDSFMTIGLFYLAVAPLPDQYSLDHLFWKKSPANPHRVGFHQRLLQTHLCFIYFFSGLAKSLGSGWWNGDSMWRALTRPPVEIIPAAVLARWSFLLQLIGISVCILEIGYPLFIWVRRTRKIWLLSVLGMHVTIGITMGMPLFALIMIVLNAAAFVPEFWCEGPGAAIAVERPS